MNHRAGLDRSQSLLFPERLEDYIAAENPVRFLDAFVGSLELQGLGFAKARCADTGRPPYDPAALLKLYLYGYLHRVRSLRTWLPTSARGMRTRPRHCPAACRRQDSPIFPSLHFQTRVEGNSDTRGLGRGGVIYNRNPSPWPLPALRCGARGIILIQTLKLLPVFA